MPRYNIVLGRDVRCYASIEVDADTPEEAAKRAMDVRNDLVYEPEWDMASEPEIACDPDECLLPDHYEEAAFKAGWKVDPYMTSNDDWCWYKPTGQCDHRAVFRGGEWRLYVSDAAEACAESGVDVRPS